MKEAAGPDYTVGVDPNTLFERLDIGPHLGAVRRDLNCMITP